jgi:tetratricopeptide (TPR) repeat protein
VPRLTVALAEPSSARRARCRYCSTVLFDGRDSPEYYTRLRDVLSASRYALIALIVAVGFAVVGIAGRIWAFIPAVIVAVFAIVDVLLALRGSKAARASELRALLDGEACRAGDARATEYGVDVAVLPTGQEWHYIRRDFEDDLREAIRAALSNKGSPLVMLSGETKSGKTRAAFQALKWDELKNACLVVPRDGASVERLLRPGALPDSWMPLIVWLDDIERYTSADASGLHDGTLRNLECGRPIVLLATVGGRGARSQAQTLMDPVEQLRSLATSIEVQIKLSDGELSRARQAYGKDLVQEIERMGIGRRMVAMNELKDKLMRSHDRSREGVAVIRAAIDWRRAGASRSLTADELDLLYRHYLPDDLDPGAELFAAGLRWARDPLPSTEISLLRRATDGTGGYEPYDLVVEVASKEWPSVDEQALTQIASLAEPQDCFQMATAAYDDGNRALALQLLARAEASDDRRLSAISAFNTGILLSDDGDLSGAEAAYRRADQRGSQRAAFNLGQLLGRNGDLAGAEAAFRRADERGSPEGAVNHGILLEESGDLMGAEAAYRRAEQRGSRKGSNNLRNLLGPRGERAHSVVGG